MAEDLSLNAGAELDDEAPVEPSHEELFGDFTPGEMPELQKDVSLLVSLEARLQDLEYLRSNIVATHGMSQQFALEAQRLLPEFDGAAPLGFYSQEPSATRLRPALESLHKGIWALIAAAIAAVLAAIAKLVHWFVKRQQDGKRAAQAAADTARDNLKKLDQLQDNVGELRTALAGGKVVAGQSDSSPGQMLSMHTLLEALWQDDTRYGHAKRFLQLPDPLFADIVQRGRYSQACRSLMPSLSAVSDVLRIKVQELHRLTQLDKRSFLASDAVVVTRSLQVIAKPVELSFQGKGVSLLDLSDRLGVIRAEVSHHEGGHEALQLDQLVKAVVEAYRSSDVVKFFQEQAEIVDVFNDLDKTLKVLEKLAGDLSQDGTQGHNKEGVAAQIREVVFKIGQDVNGYRKLFAELMVFGSYLEQAANQTLGFCQEVENQLLALHARQKIELPERWVNEAKARKHSRLEKLFAARSQE